MKVTLVVLGFACFVGALNAFPLEETNESESELVPQVLPNFEKEETVSEEEVSLLEKEEEVEPETFPNFDEAFAPNANTRPPQIHHNNIKIQAPFSGHLVNVVDNQDGLQETFQKNRIQYSFNGIRKTLEKITQNE